MMCMPDVYGHSEYSYDALVTGGLGDALNWITPP